VITPVFDGGLLSLKLLIADLQQQTLGNFIHVSVSNGGSPRTKKYLQALARTDPRFVYGEIPREKTNDYQSLLINLGKRRRWCLKKFNAARYVFLDADIKVLDREYFAKVFLAHHLLRRAVIVTQVLHSGRVAKFPTDFDMANFSFSRALAKKYPYFTNLDPAFGRGNDYRYFQTIHTFWNTLHLPFVSAEKDGNATYRRATDRYHAEKIGSNMIPVFGNKFGDRDLAGMARVLQSHLVGTGQVVTQLEETFKKMVGFKYGVATNSCTNGFWLLFSALQLSPNQEVLIPNLHFFGIRNVLQLRHIKYRVIDVDPLVPNVAVASLRGAIRRQTAAIIFLEYGGYPVALAEIKEYLRSIGRPDILLILDAANSPFTKQDGKYSAAAYDYAVYSFDMNKMLVTGDGGLVLSNQPAVMTTVRQLSYLGLRGELSGFAKAQASPDNWWDFVAGEPSIKLAMNNIAAALGLSQLEQMPEFLSKREWLKHYYDDRLQVLVRAGKIQIPPHLPGVMNNVYLYWIRLSDVVARDKLAHYLLTKNIYTTVKYQMIDDAANTPHAQQFYATSLCLPFNQNLTGAHVDYIVQAITSFFREQL
jgi:dTDP-4-amino-4,6-dideoxygalactose transaminase